MALIPPVTDRPDATTRTTWEDMQRICFNYNEIIGETVLRMVWSKFDIVDAETWFTVVKYARKYGKAVGIIGEITDFASYDNLNRIEEVIARRSAVIDGTIPQVLSFRLGMGDPVGYKKVYSTLGLDNVLSFSLGGGMKV